ncbi:MAG TPA: ATP-binding protein [Dehalococcoidia bacterium]|nr:ATP-binding protein [Dehalococcoidia bacterium]
MESARAPLFRAAQPWLAVVLALSLAIGTGVLLAEVLMAPPQGELWDLTVYFTFAGAATLGVGWLALQAADRLLGLSIQTKTFLGGLIVSGIALLNVLIVAQMMFISTDHDLKLLVAVVAFSGAVSAIFSLWVARSVSGRISRIADAVRTLAAGDLEVHAAVGGGDEAARLAADVNMLAARLREAEEQRETLDRERRELTVSISHDLRTPLASLRAMVEALDDGVVEGDEGRRYYATMRREIERINRMLDDLLELARLDAGALQLNREDVSVEEIAANVVDALQPQARLREVTVALRTNGGTVASLDGSRIERAIANLVRNAIGHTASGGRVEVSVEHTNGWIDIRVADTGEGIDAEDLPRIWERFYRAEKSRRRASETDDGAGLGLAIVRGIVEAHGGTVAAQSAPGEGATFTLRLPS